MLVSITTWLLFFSIGYLLLTSIIFLRNQVDFTTLPLTDLLRDQHRKISVCIPARNEQENIGHLLSSLTTQQYSSFDILVLDDNSTDNTTEVVTSFADKNPGQITLYKGLSKPKDWLGKPWACKQLADVADGDLLLFLDADTTIKPDTLLRIATSFKQYNLDMLTVWPHQILGSFWEKTVIPLVYYALLTLLPSIYVYRDPRWMPKVIREKLQPAFAAANGQCIAFTREAYHKIGGHTSVKKEVVEDVELAKNIKSSGLTMRMFNGVDSINCRMYRSRQEIFDGLRKNFFAGFHYSLTLFILFALLHLVIFILPFIALIAGITVGYPWMVLYSTLSVCLILLHRLWIAKQCNWNPFYAFSHPIGVLWFQWLGFIKIIDYLWDRKSEWKGRKI